MERFIEAISELAELIEENLKSSMERFIEKFLQLSKATTEI